MLRLRGYGENRDLVRSELVAEGVGIGVDNQEMGQIIAAVRNHL